MKSYRVVYELDESGQWIATVPRVKGCHTYGRSLSEARARIREALGLFVEAREALQRRASELAVILRGGSGRSRRRC